LLRTPNYLLRTLSRREFEQAATRLSHHTPDHIESKVGFNGGVEKDIDSRRKLMVPLPQDVSQGHLWEHLQAEAFVSIKNFAAPQSRSRFEKDIWVSSEKSFKFIDMESMRTPKEGTTPLEIFFADPGVSGFDLFGLSEVSEDHQAKEWLELFLDGLIVPFQPEDLFCFGDNQIPQIVNR
jgi:hypothetical protein